MEHARGTPALVQSGFPPVRSWPRTCAPHVHRWGQLGAALSPASRGGGGLGILYGARGTRTEVRRRRRPPDRDEGAYAPFRPRMKASTRNWKPLGRASRARRPPGHDGVGQHPQRLGGDPEEGPTPCRGCPHRTGRRTDPGPSGSARRAHAECGMPPIGYPVSSRASRAVAWRIATSPVTAASSARSTWLGPETRQTSGPACPQSAGPRRPGTSRSDRARIYAAAASSAVRVRQARLECRAPPPCERRPRRPAEWLGARDRSRCEIYHPFKSILNEISVGLPTATVVLRVPQAEDPHSAWRPS